MVDTTLLGMASILNGMVARAAENQEALEKAAVVIETEAKRVIGTYDYGWPQLAPSTLARKAANTPLLETGELRASIEHNADHQEAHIGTNNDKGVWQELGTSRGIPPRPFMKGAAIHKEAEVVKILGDTFYMRMITP